MSQEELPPLARARALAAAIVAASDETERARRIPEPLLARLHAARLFRMLLPRSFGGEETHPGQYLAAIEEIARHDASVAWNVFVANSSALIAAYLEPDAARSIFAEATTIVAWGPPNASRAMAVDGGYRVSGTRDFASGCRHASWMGAHCPIKEADGLLRRNRLGRPGVKTLLFPSRQATPLNTWHTIGLRGTASDSYNVSELFVPEAFSCSREDPTLRRESGPLYAFTMQGLYAVGVAGVALGIARAMLEAFIALAQNKAPRGLARRRKEQIDELPRRIAVAEAELGLAGLEHLGAIIFGRARPTRENLRVIRNGEAGTILGLKIEVRHRMLQLSGGEIAPCA